VQSQEHTLFDDAKLCSQELASFSRPCFAYRAEIAETTCNVSSLRACLCIPKPDLAVRLGPARMPARCSCLSYRCGEVTRRLGGRTEVPPRGTEAVIQRKWRKPQSLEKSLVCAAAALRTHSIVGAAPLCVQRSIACAYRWHSCRCAGADDSTARSFLRSHNNSVEQAVEAFFQGNTEADNHGVGSRPCL
jgi:hypothetical protein